MLIPSGVFTSVGLSDISNSHSHLDGVIISGPWASPSTNGNDLHSSTRAPPLNKIPVHYKCPPESWSPSYVINRKLAQSARTQVAMNGMRKRFIVNQDN